MDNNIPNKKNIKLLGYTHTNTHTDTWRGCTNRRKKAPGGLNVVRVANLFFLRRVYQHLQNLTQSFTTEHTQHSTIHLVQ